MAIIRCECGRPLRRPLPSECPDCGVLLRGVRKRIWPMVLSLLIIGGLLVGLLFIMMNLAK